MGFRFRRTFTVLPGVHINLSKTGSSVSLGRRGAMVNLGHGHETVSLGVPGTGVGYRTSSGGAILWLLVLACAIGMVWYFQPELVRKALHWWQPQWF
jgi:uncharacterized protein DUF4236